MRKYVRASLDRFLSCGEKRPFENQHIGPSEIVKRCGALEKEPGEHEVSAVRREWNARAQQLCCGVLEKRRLGLMHR